MADDLGGYIGGKDRDSTNQNQDLTKRDTALGVHHTFTGDIKIKDSNFKFEERSVVGTVMVWGHPTFGDWGEEKWGADVTASWSTIEEHTTDQQVPESCLNEIAKWLVTTTANEPSHVTVGTGSDAFNVTNSAISGHIQGFAFTSGYPITSDKQVDIRSILYSTDLFTTMSANPLAHYKLNDNAANTTVTDDSGNSKDGTATSNTDTLSTTGLINQSLDFNETDKVNVTDDTDFEFAGGDFTITCWIYLNSLPDSNDGDIFSKWGGASNAEYRFKVKSTGELRLTTSPNGSSTTNADADTALSLATWYHVGVVKSGTTATFYVNAVTDGSDTVDATLHTASAPAYIAGLNSPNDPFPGRIDDLRIYNSALDATDMRAIYNVGEGTESKNPTKGYVATNMGLENTTSGGDLFAQRILSNGYTTSENYENRVTWTFNLTNSLPVVNSGVNVVRDWLAGSSPSKFSHVGWGGGTQSLSITDSQLQSEFVRVTASTKQGSKPNIAEYNSNLTTGSGNYVSIQRIGLFNADNTASTINDCEETTGWTGVSAGSLSKNTSNFVIGTASLNLEKDSSSVLAGYRYKTGSAVDVSGSFIDVYLRVQNTATLALLETGSSTAYINLYHSTTSFNTYSQYNIRSQMTAGFKNIRIDTASPDTTTNGGVNLNSLSAIDIYLTTTDGGDLFTAGDIQMDEWRHYPKSAGTMGAVSHLPTFDKKPTIQIFDTHLIRVVQGA